MNGETRQDCDWAEWVRQQLRALNLPDSHFRDNFIHFGQIHERRFAVLASKLSPHASGRARLLDIGSFPGHGSVLLQRLGFDVTAVSQDFGKDFPQAAEFEDLLAREKISRINCDVERQCLPFPADTFDQVVLSEVIEHLAFNPFHTLSEIERVLKPGGRAWITTPNLACVRYVLRLLKGRSIHQPLDGTWSENFPTARGMKHEREFTASELRHFLQPGNQAAHEFWIEEISTHQWMPSPADPLGPRAQWLENSIARIVPALRDGLMAIGVKPSGRALVGANEFALDGGWDETIDPLALVSSTSPAAYPYAFRYLLAEATLRLPLPDGFRGKTGALLLRLPWVWHRTHPLLPPQNVRVELKGDPEVSSTMTVSGAGQVQWIPLTLHVKEPLPEALELRLTPLNPVRPDDVLHNGDVRPTGPGMSLAHIAMRWA